MWLLWAQVDYGADVADVPSAEVDGEFPERVHHPMCQLGLETAPQRFLSSMERPFFPITEADWTGEVEATAVHGKERRRLGGALGAFPGWNGSGNRRNGRMVVAAVSLPRTNK